MAQDTIRNINLVVVCSITMVQSPRSISTSLSLIHHRRRPPVSSLVPASSGWRAHNLYRMIPRNFLERRHFLVLTFFFASILYYTRDDAHSAHTHTHTQWTRKHQDTDPCVLFTSQSPYNKLEQSMMGRDTFPTNRMRGRQGEFKFDLNWQAIPEMRLAAP